MHAPRVRNGTDGDAEGEHRSLGEFEGHPLRKDFPLLARTVKPWPGLVDVEPMPGEPGEDEADSSEVLDGEQGSNAYFTQEESGAKGWDLRGLTYDELAQGYPPHWLED